MRGRTKGQGSSKVELRLASAKCEVCGVATTPPDNVCRSCYETEFGGNEIDRLLKRQHLVLVKPKPKFDVPF